MKTKKLVALVLVAVLAITSIVGTTLAYFTDSEKATNTMVIGNVEITMDEWKYTDNGWAQFNDNEFVLYPLEIEQGSVLNNKSVRTYNTSPSGDDVYIRSFVLVEANEEVALANNEDGCCFPGIHLAHDVAIADEESYVSSYDNTTHFVSKEAGHLSETVTVDGKEYWVVWYVADAEKAIPAGQALSSLHSVYMDKNVTNDQVDGWGTDGVQVIAFSQAIQAEGLTHAEAMEALGVPTVEKLEAWVAAAVPMV